MSALKLKDIFEDEENILGITQMTGKSGLMREICHVRVQRSTEEESFWDRLIPDTILIVAPLYLSKLAFISSKARKKVFQQIISSGISCIALSGNASLPDFLRSFSESSCVSAFASLYDEFLLESRLIGLLREKIENVVSLHGALVNVFGYGIVITGESGAGKTECACKLTEIGHAWIADDAVEIERRSNMLYGRSQDLVKHLIDIKYMGIIDARQHFGSASIQDETVIDLMIELQKTSHAEEKEGNSPAKQVRHRHIMGVTLPYFQLPVFPRSADTHIHVLNIARTLIRERGNS
jgi:HPr kinase/phosphorylase